ncbi:MAG: ECF-type sigma factor [Thermoguttaceae bacterium]
MNPNSEVSELMVRVRGGDGDAAQALWDRYFQKLVRRANDELGRHQRMSDGEDAALSAFNSFLEGMQEGDFGWLRNRQDLWRLLVTITVRKAGAHVRHEHREKRGGGGVFGESAFMPAGASSEIAGIAGIDATLAGKAELTPQDVALLEEEYRLLLDSLPVGGIRETAELLLLYSDKYDKKAMAEAMGCSVRTIERRCSDIVDLLSRRQARPE